MSLTLRGLGETVLSILNGPVFSVCAQEPTKEAAEAQRREAWGLGSVETSSLVLTLIEPHALLERPFFHPVHPVNPV
jgi:hypothetical protein